MTELDVIILSWNDGEMLPAAIQSALDAGSSLDVLVTVVDNASDTAPRLVDDPRVRLVRNPTNRGVAGGRNDGMAATDRELACFLDSDAVLHDDSLVKLLAVLDARPDVGMAVPVFTGQAPEASGGKAPGLRRKLSRMRNSTSEYEAFGLRPDDDGVWEVEFGIGACQLFRRSVFDEVGGLDERLWWADDVDFCLRIRRRGHRVVQVGTTRVDHPPRRRFRKPLSAKGLRHSAAVLRYLVRHRRW